MFNTLLKYATSGFFCAFFAATQLFSEQTTTPNKLPDWALGGFVRAEKNPIVRPNPESVFDCPMRKAPVKWEESDTFNPTAVLHKGKIVILYRAEDNSFKGIGSRTSRLGFAESADGINLKFRPTPAFFPAEDNAKEFEWTGGCEDPRLAKAADGTYVLTYTAWNKENRKARLCVATSKDLLNWQKHGPAFAKAYDGKYKDMYCKSGSIVTEPVKANSDNYKIAKINGKYFMYWGEHRIFGAVSDNLTDWTPLEKDGRLLEIVKPRDGFFDSALTECGPAAVKTKDGILLLYNGKNQKGAKADKRFPEGSYCAGQILFDATQPTKVLKRLDVPFFRLMADFERKGQYGDGTVFIEGLVRHKGKWFLYYGCADSLVGVAVFNPKKPTLADPIPQLKK